MDAKPLKPFTPTLVHMATRLLVLATIVLNVGCDQLSKHLIRDHVDMHAHIPLAGPFLTLTHVENTGAFLSMGHALPPLVRTVLLTLLPITVLVLALIYLMVKTRLQTMALLGASLMIGGGLGNLYDRIVYGSVTDFLHIKVAIFQTGVFNVADMSIMVGVGMLFFSGRQKESSAKA